MSAEVIPTEEWLFRLFQKRAKEMVIRTPTMSNSAYHIAITTCIHRQRDVLINVLRNMRIQ